MINDLSLLIPLLIFPSRPNSAEAEYAEYSSLRTLEVNATRLVDETTGRVKMQLI